MRILALTRRNDPVIGEDEFDPAHWKGERTLQMARKLKFSRNGNTEKVTHRYGYKSERSDLQDICEN